jgi:hypothetical protein
MRAPPAESVSSAGALISSVRFAVRALSCSVMHTLKSPALCQVLCQMCGKRFAPVHPTRAKYCSRACRQRYRRRQVTAKKWRAQQEKALPIKRFGSLKRSYGALTALWISPDGILATLISQNGTQTDVYRCDLELFAKLSPHLVDSARNSSASQIQQELSIAYDDDTGWQIQST